MTDPIADMLTRIRNAQMVKKNEVIIPYSRLKYAILNLLAGEGWIGAVEKVAPVIDKTPKSKKNTNDLSRFETLKVVIKYQRGRPLINKLERVSKPGHRVYVGKTAIPFVLNGQGMAVISTPAGLMTDKEARQKAIGGEVICQVY